MMTLDEVIKALTICKNPDINRNCKDCPMPDTHGCMDILMTDALHYLKEYREKREEICKIAKIMADSWELRKQTMAFEDRNEPLTWDELKQMEGKPVWVEHKHYNKWLVVYEVYENTIVLDGNGFYTQYFSDDNDKEVRWQAYRKERE